MISRCGGGADGQWSGIFRKCSITGGRCQLDGLQRRSEAASIEAGRRAVAEAFERRGIAARVTQPELAAAGNLGIYCHEFPDDGPTVTILIPTKNQVTVLRQCVESLLRDHPIDSTRSSSSTMKVTTLRRWRICTRFPIESFDLVILPAGLISPPSIIAP